MKPRRIHPVCKLEILLSKYKPSFNLQRPERNFRRLVSKFSGSLIGPAEASSKKNAFINISLTLKLFSEFSKSLEGSLFRASYLYY